MGAQERQPVPDLTAARGALEKNAHKYAFFQLMYLLERVHPKSPAVGQLGPVADERVRIRPDSAMTFAAGDVRELAWIKCNDGTERSRLTVTFLGLYGSSSPLANYFIEPIAHAEFQGERDAVRELYDVVNHRLTALFYRVWKKYRLGVGYRSGGDDPFTRRMFCTVGLDGFRGHDSPIDKFLLLRYAPILASKSRSARGLNVVLAEMFGSFGVKIEQFVGHWTKIEKPYRNKMGVMNHQLGVSLTIGRYVFDGSGRYTIVLGPLGYDDYLSFLPGGHRRPMLRGVCATFTQGIFDVMLELHVKPDAAPKLQLGSPRASTLKRTAWLGGSAGQPFVLTVPLEEPKTDAQAEAEDDDDRGEPPPV